MYISIPVDPWKFFTAEEVIRTEGVQLIPKQFTLAAYEMVCKGGGIWKSYLLTIILTVVGTAVGLTIIAMTGYALQRKDFPFRNGISFYIYFTSLFSAGLAPYYLLMTQTYHLKDSYFAVLLPLMMSPWLIIMRKNFVKANPRMRLQSPARSTAPGYEDLCFPDPANVKTGTCDDRIIPCTGILE